MNEQAPGSIEPDQRQNTYILTDQGLVLEQEPSRPAAPAPEQRSWGSPLLWLSLVLAALAYYLDAGKWVKSVEASIDRRQRAVACGPYRAWAAQHPLSYDEVASDPSAWAGKPVLWEVSRGADGSYYFGQDAAKKISWTDPAACASAGPAAGGPAVRVLALVESSEGATPLLILLSTF
jgi:hypothetical protein